MAKKSEEKKLEELQARVNHIVGFDAYSKRGPKMSPSERRDIIEYLHQMHGNSRAYYELIVPFARPFDISDQSFQKRCLKCKSLVNYCCC